MSVLESIVQKLESLPETKLIEVAHFVSSMNAKLRAERSAAILATAGCMSGAAGEEFERFVREEADRIDVDDAPAE